LKKDLKDASLPSKGGLILSKKRIKPLGEYVLIGVTDSQETTKTKSGLVMPAINNTGKHSGSLCRGKIIDLPKSQEDKGILAVNQIVLYPEWAGHAIEEVSGSSIEDSEYSGHNYKKIILVKAEEIKAIVEGAHV
jgi:co-chaperonin GroES (HSP10)